MNYWLMKTEPSVFSFEDLCQAPGRKTPWEGVRNYQARNLMRDKMKMGDKALIYHSGIDDPCIAGIAEIVREGYPDLTALDPKSRYFDEACKKKGESCWAMVDVRAMEVFKTPVLRSTLKDQASLSDLMVLKRGARLSVQPVSAKHFQTICKLGHPKPL